MLCIDLQVPEGVEEPVSPATMGYKDAPSSTGGALPL